MGHEFLPRPSLPMAGPNNDGDSGAGYSQSRLAGALSLLAALLDLAAAKDANTFFGRNPSRLCRPTQRHHFSVGPSR
jgi:hypothetical protein